MPGAARCEVIDQRAAKCAAFELQMRREGIRHGIDPGGVPRFHPRHLTTEVAQQIQRVDAVGVDPAAAYLIIESRIGPDPGDVLVGVHGHAYDRRS